ncbi:hypothetical protein PVAND_014391 [Polypedilum vanderplanki]|uniref:Integrase catalytic domain-containing protein n=1 Tax=Polypedilum vanderplanki TaxID=319348 RepID=A0A9J6B9I7_POLVA|nr:hypothetical protein PVAND_014391 [Polypedilum vanderplanki]
MWSYPGFEILFFKSKIKIKKKKSSSSIAISQDPKLLTAAYSNRSEYYKDDVDAWSEKEQSFYFSIKEQSVQESVIHDAIDQMADVVVERDQLKEENSLLQAKLKRLDELEKQLKELKNSNTDKQNVSNISFGSATSSTFCDPSISAKDILSMIYLKASKKNVSSTTTPTVPVKAKSIVSDDESGGGLTQPDTSCWNSIDMSSLDNTEKIILEQANAQRESTIAQRAMSKAMLLEQQRKNLQKINPFNGDERDWLRYKRDIQRYKDIGKYDDEIMKLCLIKSLEGVAADRVRDLVDAMPFEYTMRVLEETFGDPTRIINKRGEDILALRIKSEFSKEDAINIVTKIQAYFAACKHADIDIANTNHLAMHIFNQLNSDRRERCRKFHREENGNDTKKLIDLETIFKFLEIIMKDLDDKKVKATQVNVTAYVSSGSGRSNGPKPDRYFIKDVSEAKYYGYDTKLLDQNDKKCLMCNNSHFTVEFKKYYAMEKDERSKFVQNKGICRNCIISTSHLARECKLKPSCGLITNGNHCQGKHHVSLHGCGGRYNAGRNNFGRRFNRQNNSSNSQSVPASNASPAQDKADKPTVADEIRNAPSLSQLGNAQNKWQRDILKKNDNSSSLNSFSLLSANTGQGNTIKVFKTKFYANNGKFVVDYSVGDSAAETTLMSEELRQELRLNGVKCPIKLQWADSSSKLIDATRVDLTVCGVQPGAKQLVLQDCYAVRTEDFCLPLRSLNMTLLKKYFPYLKPVQCSSYKDITPKLLIGSHHAAVIESCGKLLEGGPGKPVGLLAKLGWSVYGGCPDVIEAKSVSNIQIGAQRSESALSNEELFEAFSYFNSIENLNVKEIGSKYTENELKAVKIMEEEMRILKNGAFEVPLVWNQDGNIIPRLPNNLPMVLKRQLSHEAKLLKIPEQHHIYNEKFKELIEEGYVRAATIEDLTGDWPNVNYLPMTLVINQDKIPVGYRIVFDAAAKYLQTSLNQNLLKGPDLLVNLYEPLIYSRTKAVAINADIKAMFMQMRMNIRDQQCQRILFRETPNEEMKVFIVTRVLFGPACSPFQSQFCKNVVAETWKDIYPEAAKAIQRFMYMDDLLTAEATTEKVLKIAMNCIEIFDSVRWKLIQFQSNDVEFLKRLPNGSVKQDIIPLMEDNDKSCEAKVLGCMWNTKEDCFQFNFDKNLYFKLVKDCQERPTKRIQSSTIARIFDIMGFLSHLVIRGRILLQRSWQNGIDWDQPITENEHKLWLEWLAELENAAKIKIPRQLCEGKDLFDSSEVEIHAFCDAGAEAYASVVYVVSKHKGKRTSRIVMARAKVTPLRYKSKTKVTEIPRLELFAALSAARLTHMITNCLPGLNLKRYLWSDSEIVLRWINYPNMPLKAYAKSPIEEILNKSDQKEWRHVPTKLNVADIATKFKKIDFGDSNSLWFTGPEFIRHEISYWPPEVELKPKIDEKLEVCVYNIAKVNVIEVEFKSPIKLPKIDDPIANEQQISNLPARIRATWIKIVRATARGLKLYMDGFIPLVKSKKYNDAKTIEIIKAQNFNILTPLDLDRAELFLVRRAQRQNYSEDYETFLMGKSVSNKEMQQLQVFIDDQGVLRIHSRVKLAAARSKYWIPSVRVALKIIQDKCNFCRYLRTRPYAPLMAPLPTCRIDPTQFPFQTTGVDCAGPITVRIYNREKKIWILIFSCTLTRFIQLHILESLHSLKVMEAIALFWSSNGPVQTFISDRGTNFVGAKNFIREEYERTKSELIEVHGQLANELASKYRVEWKLLPAHSPWMGGFYERLIKEVKRSIATVLENRKLSKIELNIALQDACHRINCRPLSHNPISADDEEVLTPHHLARGRPGWPYLPSYKPSEPDPQNDRSVFRRGRLIADEIMRLFVHGYLPVLTKRTKWFKDISSPLRIGDIVLLIEPDKTRRQWKRARVIKLYKAKDRRSRVADVELPCGTIKEGRSIQRLAKLELDTTSNEV